MIANQTMFNATLIMPQTALRVGYAKDLWCGFQKAVEHWHTIAVFGVFQRTFVDC